MDVDAWPTSFGAAKVFCHINGRLSRSKQERRAIGGTHTNAFQSGHIPQ